MAILTCGAVNCAYNKEHLCCKGDIMVGGKHAKESSETNCDSFYEKKCGCGDTMTSSTSHPSNMISIDCEAIKCIYNKDYRCSAEKVAIQGNSAKKANDTVCATFKEE